MSACVCFRAVALCVRGWGRYEPFINLLCHFVVRGTWFEMIYEMCNYALLTVMQRIAVFNVRTCHPCSNISYLKTLFYEKGKKRRCDGIRDGLTRVDADAESTCTLSDVTCRHGG